MRHRLTVIALVILLVPLLLAGGKGYVVFLKNGKTIRARESLRIEGTNALIVLPSGALASYPLDQIDLVRTERYNKLGMGDALIIDEGNLENPLPPPTPTPSLGGMATIEIGSSPVLGHNAPPTPTPTPGIQLHDRPYHESRVDRAFTQYLDDRKLYTYRTSVGSQPEYYFVQATTDDDRAVFQALKAVCEAYSVIYELDPDLAPVAVELQMISMSGKPAGTFRITPEMARSLAAGELSAEQFYVSYVIF